MEVNDPTIYAVSRAFESVWPREQERVRRSFLLLLPRGYQAGVILEPAAATEYLRNVCSRLEAEARVRAQIYSPAGWLWYFRRISREYFAGHLSTTAPADHGLAETLTGLSDKTDDMQRGFVDGAVVYPTDEIALRPVARMASLAVAMSQCHAWIRRAGKGTRFTVHVDRLPEPVGDPLLEDSIEQYDERVAEDPGGTWLQGLRSLDRSVPSMGLLLTVASLPGLWPVVPSWLGQPTDSIPAQVRGQFVFWPTSLDDLRRALDRVADDTRQWWPDALPSLVLLLQGLMYVLVRDGFHMGVGVPKVGYTTLPREGLIRALDWKLELSRGDLEAMFRGSVPRTGEEALARISEIGPVCWPFQPGPVLRAGGQQVVVDLHAATQRLVHMVTMPRDLGGDVVNVISDEFELFVQDALDRSSWRPTERMATLRGRDLKLTSKKLTDVDAIGQHGRALLLVSCKNMPHTERYAAGEYSVVRNVEQRLNEAVRQWDQVIATVRRHPVGDNYDFSAFDEILGVVVTPHVMFSRAPETTAIVKGELRKAVGLGELLRFVKSRSRLAGS
ncbi:hypothetical protein RAM_36465 [Amycolatopsis mediterranei S699]|uniref:Uncharacterized protein n=1 Tax=Amycolatopsis mediterranei (strain S699) TaxID=713604 RepID=A0A9R0P3R2_AMYMS|nr:hypothetical protein RAM_36465 [Amycolatopsis mediterranei S699]